MTLPGNITSTLSNGVPVPVRLLLDADGNLISPATSTDAASIVTAVAAVETAIAGDSITWQIKQGTRAAGGTDALIAAAAGSHVIVRGILIGAAAAGTWQLVDNEATAISPDYDILAGGAVSWYASDPACWLWRSLNDKGLSIAAVGGEINYTVICAAVTN